MKFLRKTPYKGVKFETVNIGETFQIININTDYNDICIKITEVIDQVLLNKKVTNIKSVVTFNAVQLSNGLMEHFNPEDYVEIVDGTWVEDAISPQQVSEYLDK